MPRAKIIIVGGGLNGLGCAKRLTEQGEDFLLVSENIGGRVKTSPDGQTNYGAYYITADCANIMPYITKKDLVHFAKAHFHSGHTQYRAFSLRMLRHIPAGLRLLKELFIFRRHVQAARARAMHTPYRELIEADPYLKRYYHQNAKEFIKEKNLEALTKEYLEQFLWAAYFTDPREVPTTIFLGVLSTIIIPSYSFIFHFDILTKPFKNKIIIDRVTSLARHANNTFTLETKSGTQYECDILILATPMDIANTLITPQKIKGQINVNYYHLRGVIKKEYDVPWYNFFPIEEEAAISHEPNGTFLYFYNGDDRIGKYFDTWEVITKGTWQPALFFFGDEYINEHPEPNIYLANDHDVPSTEDAFINGHYIANCVLHALHSQIPQ